ncbi:cytochrome P450 [Actinoplanes sp. KI2]|uniref:cytochrome P450 n=1 Tax=Actinoplanes sp. KI2 TaxID=2983315 RepID=UPI0021D5DF2B|nr:cytochrome P450 [Actinoplanes sp. KI2]MCU7728476.1 cytochrome P450 [Actinoplanes sp. KI2]
MTVEDLPAYPFRSGIPMQPPKEWAELRERCPVAAVQLPSGDAASLITRYEEARTLLSDPRFTRQIPADATAKVGASADGGVFSRQAATNMRIFEGEGHVQWRRLMAKAFTIRRVDSMRPRVEAIADELIDDLVAGGPPGDLAASIGAVLPVRVIGDLLGVPKDDLHRFSAWSDRILTLTRYTKEEVDAARYEFGAYLAGLIERKRERPGDDLLSELISVSDSDDGRLELRELIISAMAILVAGYETTANMIGKMMAMLLTDRRQFEAVLADPSVVPSAVDEVLRFDTNPSIGVPRYVTEDIEVGGTMIAQGSTVIVSPAVANRDPRRFPDPERMDLRRPNNQHLSFGAGPHFCLGAPLARVELQVVLATLARRLPGLRLAVDPAELRVKQGLIVVGFEQVPVAW